MRSGAFHRERQEGGRELAVRTPIASEATGFRMFAEPAEVTIQGTYAALVADEARNRQIVDDVFEAVRDWLTPLVLTNRTDHLEKLSAALSRVGHLFV